MMEKAYFIKVIENIKKIAGLKRDFEIAKVFGITPSNFAHYKNRGSIPFFEIIRFCKNKSIPLDKVFSDEAMPSMASESDVPYGHVRFNELCKKLEKVLLKGNIDEKAKVMGIIEALSDDLDKRETEYKEAEPISSKRIQKHA